MTSVSSATASASASVPILGLLGVLFVGLKLTGFINWSWWWVTLPFWGGLAFFIALAIIGIVSAVTFLIIKGALNK